jgi:hypothetical protein
MTRPARKWQDIKFTQRERVLKSTTQQILFGLNGESPHHCSCLYCSNELSIPSMKDQKGGKQKTVDADTIQELHVPPVYLSTLNFVRAGGCGWQKFTWALVWSITWFRTCSNTIWKIQSHLSNVARTLVKMPWHQYCLWSVSDRKFTT